MSDQSRDKIDRAQDLKEPLEQPEKLPEQPQAEAPRTEAPQIEEPWPEEPWPEELWPEGLWPEEPQAEESGTGQQPERSEKKTAPPPAKKRAKPKKTQRIIMIVMIVLAALMVIVTALVLLHNRWFKKPPLPPGPDQSDSGSNPSASVPPPGPSASQNPDPSASPGIITVQPLAGGKRRSEDFYTILIFGMDVTSGTTDTIMVASYDVTNQKAAVMSIPRDTLINNDFFDSPNKAINAVYSQYGRGENGALALKAEVSRLIGFVPDYYVTINWELVGQMVDAIGGVYFDIPWHMGYDDPVQNLHIHFEQGYQYLDGPAAMNLVRWRQNNDGTFSVGGGSDLSRLNIQHDFLKAVLKQTLQPQNIVRIPELIRLFNENVISDLAVENMLWFGEQAVLGGLGVDDVEFITMPVYGTSNYGGRYYGKVCPITEQLLDMVNGSLNPYVEDVTLRQLDLIQMSDDGNILSSTTGTLRNPDCGIFTYPDDPPASEPPEDDPGATDPTESDPGTTDPVESDPGTTAPVESDPGTTDPVESNPGTTDPTESDPGTTAPVESDPGTTAPVESDPGTTDPVESDPGAADPVESDPGPSQTDDPPPEPAETGGDRPDD